jgi:hypothetical protein
MRNEASARPRLVFYEADAQLRVKLDDVVTALRDTDRTTENYLDLKTGEIYNVDATETPAARYVYKGINGRICPRLPTADEVDTWEIIKRFTSEIDGDAGGALHNAIHGAGAFRYFRDTLEEHGLRDRWDDLLWSELEKIARRWFYKHGIADKHVITYLQ